MSMDAIEQACYDIADHLNALKEIAEHHAKSKDSTCEESGLMRVFAASLADVLVGLNSIDFEPDEGPEKEAA